MHYYSHNIGDFNNSPRHLTRVERALYRELIELYYDTEQPLQSVDFDRLSKRVLAHSEEEKTSLSYVLSEFFVDSGSIYTHARCDLEIAKYRANTTAKAKAGIASAKARQAKSKKVKQKSTPVEQTLNACATKQEPINNKQETINNKSIVEAAPQPVDEVQVIFDYWVMVMKKNASCKLTPERKKFIDARLKQGYELDYILKAIDGCSKSSYHMGQNDKGTKYNCLSLICRDGDKLEQFAENIGVIPQEDSQIFINKLNSGFNAKQIKNKRVTDLVMDIHSTDWGEGL